MGWSLSLTHLSEAASKHFLALCRTRRAVSSYHRATLCLADSRSSTVFSDSIFSSAHEVVCGPKAFMSINLVATASRPPAPFLSKMPVVTRSYATLSRRSLLGLPPELLTQTCRDVIADSSPTSHHVWFEESCDGGCRGLKKRAIYHRYTCRSPASRILYLLYSRRKCPPLLLVNKYLYSEAVKYMSEDQVFEMGDDWEGCLGCFTHIVPKDRIPSSTVFDVGAIQ